MKELTVEELKYVIECLHVTFPKAVPITVIFMGNEFKWTGTHRAFIIGGYGRLSNKIVRFDPVLRIKGGKFEPYSFD